MTLQHFPHQDTDGSWHAVYQSPQTAVLNSVGNALTETGAISICNERNKEQSRMAAQAAQAALHPADRSIPKGFYSED